MRVPVEVEEVLLENEDGREVPGVCVTCTRCEAAAECFGTSERSVTRCIMELKESCSEKNFYVTEGDGTD